MTTSTLAHRLARALVLRLALVWVLCVLAVAFYLNHEIEENFDAELAESAHRMFDVAMFQLQRAAPGAAAGQLNGVIIALDILPMEPIEGVTYLNGDLREPEVLERLEQALAGRVVDVVVSDMAPNLSGIESADAARIAHLVELAVDFAGQHLKPEGVLVVKLFHGSGYSQLVKLFKDHFRVVKPVKPKASRPRSAETFLVGVGLKAPTGRAAGADS